MTAPDGLPRHMDLFAIDTVTAERLVRGAVDVGDAPPEYRAVARVFEVLREAPDSAELVGRAAAVDRIAAAVRLERRPSRSRRSRRLSRRRRRAAAAVVTCVLILTSVLATAGALPESAQAVASTVLRRVGISVPTGSGNPADQQPPPPPSGPAPTATGSVPSTPIGNGRVPASGPDASPTSPHGNDQGDLHRKRSRGTRPPTAKDGGNANSTTDSPPKSSGDANSTNDSPQAGNGDRNSQGK